MDAQTVLGAIGAALAVGAAIVGIAMHAGKSRSVADDAMHKARNVEAAHHAFTAVVDHTYVRKDAIAPRLDAIDASLKRLEEQQAKVFDRLMGGV